MLFYREKYLDIFCAITLYEVIPNLPLGVAADLFSHWGIVTTKSSVAISKIFFLLSTGSVFKLVNQLYRTTKKVKKRFWKLVWES